MLQKTMNIVGLQLYSLVEKGQEAVDGALDVAQQSDSASIHMKLLVNLSNMLQIHYRQTYRSTKENERY